MRDPNERETWMATLLTKGAAEASQEIGATSNAEALNYCDWVQQHNWQKTYTAIVEGKTVETVGKGAFEFDIAVPDGMTMQMHEVDGRHVISFEPEPRQMRNFDGSPTTPEEQDAIWQAVRDGDYAISITASGYGLTHGLINEFDNADISAMFKTEPK